MPIRRPAPIPDGAVPGRKLVRRQAAGSEPEVLAARIGASAVQVSARTAAIFALVAAVAGGLTGAVSAYLTSQSQITAEDRRSESEFLREQRQNAYAALITAQSEAV